jgi:hypothetical protein
MQGEDWSDDEEGYSKTVDFLVEEGEEPTERHDKLKRTNTPHYTKGKRLYPDKEDIQEKFHEIMAKVGQTEDEDSDEQRVSIFTNILTILNCKVHMLLMWCYYSRKPQYTLTKHALYVI